MVHSFFSHSNHSTCGVSRSASFVIGFLMRERGYAYEAAFKLLYSKRHIIQPNIFFVHQLKTYEKYALSEYAKSETVHKSEEEDKKCSPKTCKYLCYKCRTLVFKTSGIATHSAGKIECTSYFIEMQPWMKINGHTDKGNIQCPNIKVLIWFKIT